MYKIFLCLFVASLTSASAQADSYHCSLIPDSGRSTSLRIELGDAIEFLASAKSQEDLNFSLHTTCKKKKCWVEVTYTSKIVRDEIGTNGFEFERGSTKQRIFEESEIDAPDNKVYKFFCDYSIR